MIGQSGESTKVYYPSYKEFHLKYQVAISSKGITHRSFQSRLRQNLPYYGIARRAAYLTDPLVEDAIKYIREIDISAMVK